MKSAFLSVIIVVFFVFGADTSFGSFIQKVRDNHFNNPKNKQWYTVRGITQNNFISMLERAADIADGYNSITNTRIEYLDWRISQESVYFSKKGNSSIPVVNYNCTFRK